MKSFTITWPAWKRGKRKPVRAEVRCKTRAHAHRLAEKAAGHRIYEPDIRVKEVSRDNRAG